MTGESAAPAEMPGVEDRFEALARLIAPEAFKAFDGDYRPGQSAPSSAQMRAIGPMNKARASARAFFAPIMAEKERLEGETRRLAAERENFRKLYVDRDRMAEEHLADRLTVEASRDHWMREAQRLLKAGQDTLDRMEAAESALAELRKQMLADEGQHREAVAAERERCAKIADARNSHHCEDDWEIGSAQSAEAIAAAIRAQD